MRPLTSDMAVRAVATACVLVALVATSRAAAQSDVAKEGALFLLIPVGARSVGLGQAVVAGEPGSEGIWENPASLARLTRTELAINHSTSIIGQLDAFVLVVPRGPAGVFSIGAYLLDYGRQPNTDSFGTVIGASYPKDVIYAASYAVTFGSHLRAGLTYKFLQDRQDCSGDCTGILSNVASTSAYDLGVQATIDKAKRLTVGAAVRSIGLALQINDVDQADPLPTRIHLGAQYLVPSVERIVAGGELSVSAEFVTRPALDAQSWRGGVEFAYLKQLYVRAGLASGTVSDPAAGISIGFGLQRGGLSLDFARSTGGVSADAGQPPTFVTLRFRF
jgi:hypothetical protein